MKNNQLSKFRNISAVIFVLLTLSSCGYNSYEDCILGEMKGQPERVLPNAEKVCERQHPFEKLVAIDEFDISMSTNFLEYGKALTEKPGSAIAKLIFTATAQNSEYRLTKAFIELSKKDCSELKFNKRTFSRPEFDINFTVSFDSEGKGYYSAEDAWDYECMRSASYYGIIDN